MLVPVHHVRGRMRLHVAALKGCPAEATAVQSRVSAIRGVTQVDCRVLTGSVIVHYDAALIEPCAVLQALGHADAISLLARCSPAPARRHKQPRSRAQHMARKAAQRILWYALENAAERALPMLIAAVL
ncbi:MAG: hypothetical protein JO061_08765 [Acidobacteriaceae bacterium]|nr:hypothetical protein [Acidobacteriaceae bacterium]